jgi:hypothetical protein
MNDCYETCGFLLETRIDDKELQYPLFIIHTLNFSWVNFLFFII